MKHIIELIVQLLTSWGLPTNVATNLSITILFIGLTILIYIIDVVLKKIIRATFTKIETNLKRILTISCWPIEFRAVLRK